MCKLLILILFVLNTSPALAERHRELSVVCEEWPNTTNKNGTGAYWEIIKRIYEPVGIKVNTMTMLWKRAKMEVRLNRVNAIVGAYYQANSPHYLYPKWHITIEYPIVAIYKKGKFENWNSGNLKAIEGSWAAWTRGYDFDNTFLKDIKIKKQEVNSDTQGLKMISSDMQDIYFDYEPHIRHAAKLLGMDLDKDYEIKKVKPGSKLYLAFSRSDYSRKMIDIFDNRMDKLVKSGEIKNIYAKWGMNPKKFDEEKF